MFSALRTRYGIPGIIATVALVFAMTGGAFAAKYLITSTKQISPSVLKKLKGATGPAGVAGAQGPAGPAGAKGDAGAAGQNGAPGEKGAQGEKGEKGIKGEKGAQGEKGEKGADGADGSPWTAGGTLPSGETETGAWGGSNDAEGTFFIRAPISFSIPLAGPLDAAHVIQVPVGEPNANCDDGLGEAPSAENPEADKGYLCVFQGAFGESVNIQRLGESLAGASKVGAIVTGLFLENEAEEVVRRAQGTWAVTAP